MQTAQIALTCRGAKVEANASKATVDGNTNKLTTLKNAATALHNNTKGVEMKNEQLLSRISALNLNS